MSAIERAWEGERRRKFDAQELLVFAVVFDLPIVWFLLPPPGDERLLQATDSPVSRLLASVLGHPDQFEALYDRIGEHANTNPVGAACALEELTGIPTDELQHRYRAQSKQLLDALLDANGDELDRAAEVMGDLLDRLRYAGLRGFITEHLEAVEPAPDGPESIDQPAARREGSLEAPSCGHPAEEPHPNPKGPPACGLRPVP